MKTQILQQSVFLLSSVSFIDSSCQREQDAGSSCIISMVSTSITIQDPRESQNRRAFCFDYAYWSHSGFTRDRKGLYVPEEPGGRYADQVSSKTTFLKLSHCKVDFIVLKINI